MFGNKEMAQLYKIIANIAFHGDGIIQAMFRSGEQSISSPNASSRQRVGAYCDLHVRLQKAVFGHDDDSSRLFRCIILALVI